MPTAGDGDCILSIAKALGIRNYKTLWDANATLKSSRPNPNMLVVGDTVEEPPKVKVEVKATGNRWTFVIADTHPASLQIVLLDAALKPLEGAAWVLSEPVSKSGTTLADGVVRIDGLPLDAKKGVLKVTPKAPAPVTPSTTTAPSSSGPPPYPASIKPVEFVDALRAADPSDAFIEWELKIGGLPAHNHATGVWARLDNLGACDSGNRGPASVKAYQLAFLGQKTGSGRPADIQDDLRDRHDKKP